MAKETAEQKLLKLIENSSPAGASVESAGQETAQKISQAVRGQGGNSFALPPFLRSILGMGKLSAGGPVHFSFGLKQLNNVLILVIVFIFLYISIDFFAGVRFLQKKIDMAIQSNTTKGLADIIAPMRSLDDFFSIIEGRNIFQPFEKKTEEDKTAADSNPKKIETMAEKIKLVGISWIDLPETASVMIEDKDSGETHFVRQGEKIKDLTIKTIYADRVVLTYEGEEITIKL